MTAWEGLQGEADNHLAHRGVFHHAYRGEFSRINNACQFEFSAAFLQGLWRKGAGTALRRHCGPNCRSVAWELRECTEDLEIEGMLATGYRFFRLLKPSMGVQVEA